MRRKRLGIILVLASLVVGALFVLKVTTGSQVVPSEIKKQVSFPLYIPAQDITPFTIDKNSLKTYPDPGDSQMKIFSFVLTSPGNKITFTEQVAPDLVSEQIGLDKLASLMQAYKEIITSVGRVELTRPKELKGGQTAVAVPNFTTLIFAKPEIDLTENDWRKIFNSLEIVK